MTCKALVCDLAKVHTAKKDRTIETVRDAKGRTLVLRPMTAIERLDFFEMAGANATNPAWLGMASMAAMVRQIDDVPWPFVKSRVQLRVLMERLGDGGLDAVREHMIGGDEQGEDTPTGDTTAEAELKATAGN